MRKFISQKFAKNLANAIFMGKLYYAAELWGGAPNFVKKKFQHLQLEMARTVLGPKSWRWSKSHLLREMGWMEIDHILAFTANKLIYKMLHQQKPELMSFRLRNNLNVNTFNTRLSGPNKLGSRPKNIGRTKMTKNQFRVKAYIFYSQIPEEIQNLSNFDHFVKWTKKILPS